MELARKLAREMEQNKTVSVSQVYVPNEYTVYLSPSDRDRFANFEGSLTAELSAYLAAYANAEGLSLLSDPLVLLETDADLRMGEFGISCRTTDHPGRLHDAPPQPPAPASPLASQSGALDSAGDDAVPVLEGAAEHPADEAASADGEDEIVDVEDVGAGADDLALVPPVPTLRTPPVPAVPPAAPPPPTPPRPAPNAALRGVSGTQILSADEARAAGLTREALFLVMGGRRLQITKRVTTIGRSKDNDVVVNDPNASRRHAEIRHVGLDYFLVDLESTNGLEVNGQKSRRHALAAGDVITIGTTQIRVDAG